MNTVIIVIVAIRIKIPSIYNFEIDSYLRGNSTVRLSKDCAASLNGNKNKSYKNEYLIQLPQSQRQIFLRSSKSYIYCDGRHRRKRTFLLRLISNDGKYIISRTLMMNIFIYLIFCKLYERPFEFSEELKIRRLHLISLQKHCFVTYLSFNIFYQFAFLLEEQIIQIRLNHKTIPSINFFWASPWKISLKILAESLK